MRQTIALGCLMLIASFCGCSNAVSRRPAYPVHGRITYEGKPVSRATVLFVSVDPADREYQPNTMTDADGKYSLTTYKSNDGAPAGEFVVAITWPDPKAKTRKPTPGEEPEDVQAPDLLRGNYWPMGKSKLRATVKPEPDNEINFTLP